MERKYPKDLLNQMNAKAFVSTERGLPILVKPIPDDDRPGVMDPRLYAQMGKMFKGIRGLVMKAMMKRMRTQPISAETMRKMFNDVKSVPITSGVKETRIPVKNGDVEVPVRIYTPEAGVSAPQPVLYYIHGGGFAAGRPEVVEEICKLVVQNTGFVALQPDYRLAPEHPFPAGLDDCFAVLRWAYENIAGYGGNPEKICISGDSAGGNLATVCAMRDRDEGTHMAKLQALIYPTVNMAGVPDEEFHFSMDEYEINPGQAGPIKGFIGMMGSMTEGSLTGLLGVSDPTQPYLSPYLGNLANLPPCIILYGEFDYLRVEDEAYARKLQKAGVTVKAVRYRGLSHGFADQIGVQPQAEDCMDEIAGFMAEYFEK